MRVLGLDIGGANVKASTADGESVCIVFPIWQNKDGLKDVLRELPLFKADRPDVVALTMTAELADCFVTKAEGVEFIVRAVMAVFPDSLIRVWLTSGEFVEPLDAIELPELAAAGNWHALATWAGRAVPTGSALLVDVGSTSTDVIPMVDGVPVPEGRTDLERLIASELLYTGISRTPVCAVVQKVPLLRISETSDKGDEVFVPVAAENFATALDVHLLNGDIPADERNLQTADGRPATRQGSLNRLAHLLCCDLTELDEEQLVHIAAYVADQQLEQISAVIRNRCAYLRRISNAGSATKIQILLSGSGSWLAEKAVVNIADSALASVSSLSDMFVRNVSSCAPAFAVARLASERCVDDLLPMEIF